MFTQLHIMLDSCIYSRTELNGIHFEHLYSPRMVEEIKEEKKMEHQTNKQ